MTYRIAINGFGRIGRNYLRRLVDKKLANAGLQVVAINDLYDAATLAHLLEYDSTFGRLDAEVGSDGDKLNVGRHEHPDLLRAPSRRAALGRSRRGPGHRVHRQAAYPRRRGPASEGRRGPGAHLGAGQGRRHRPSSRA